MAAEIHVDTIGLAFTVTVRDENNSIVDLSGASSKVIKFRKPTDGSVMQRSADFVTDGTDGKMRYVMASGELNQVGIWRMQGFATISGSVFPSNIQVFSVEENIEGV